jgi:site-specific DNA-methyltransferase (adenine-specific)
VDTRVRSTRAIDEVPRKIRRNIYFKTSEKMLEVEDDSVQAVVTSPPYWNLKDYGHASQIGFGESYEKYHERLNAVWSECKRVLRQDGTMWIVIDKITQTEEITHIPYDIAHYCRTLGFLLQDMIIWNKPTAIAGMSPLNLVNKFEHVLFLSKSKDVKLRKPKEQKQMPPDWTKESTRLTDFWRIPVKAGSIRKTPAHEAPYPDELIRRIILLSTDERDIVLDPFLGSGTTMKVALQLNRSPIGYEINPDFAPVIADALRGLQPPHLTPSMEEFA